MFVVGGVAKIVLGEFRGCCQNSLRADPGVGCQTRATVLAPKYQHRRRSYCFAYVEDVRRAASMTMTCSSLCTGLADRPLPRRVVAP